MDRLTPLSAHVLPYTQATSTQLSQALLDARDALGPYYPALTWQHWHRAFRDLQPPLCCNADRTTVTLQGLAELTRYFEVLPLSQVLEVEASNAPTRIKKTYSIELEILEQLARVSFWRREKKSHLVNLALTRLLATYSEAHTPIPPAEDLI